MFTYVTILAVLATCITVLSVLMLIGISMHHPQICARVRLFTIIGWGSSALGWGLLAAFLLAPLWFRLLV